MDPLALAAPILTCVALAAGVVGARQLYAGSVSQWSIAWAALISAGFFRYIEGTFPFLGPSRELFGALFPYFLLSGVVAWADRTMPRSLLPLALLLGVTRAVCHTLDLGPTARFVELGADASLYLAAAVYAYTTTRRRDSAFVETLLAPTILLLGVVDAADSLAEAQGLETIPWVLWAALIVPLGTIQFFCAMERAERARLVAERELGESEDRFRRLSEDTRDVITEVDSEGQLLYMSPNVREILGWDESEFRGLSITEIAQKVEFSQMELIAGGSVADLPEVDSLAVTASALDRSGRRRWLETRAHRYAGPDGRPHAIAVTRDVSDRKRLEEKLVEHRKLESLGLLAGGIAHDFNNLLVAVLGNTGLARREIARDSPAQGSLAEVETAAERAADLTQRLLAYAGQIRVEMKLLDFSDVVEEAVALLAARLPGNVRLHLDLDDELPRIQGDASQLRQVLRNLIENAVEAIGAESGRILVRATAVAPEAEGPSATPSASGAVVVEVIDSGHGMDADTRIRIFDPFFSTRGPGRGLGLSAAVGIVRRHGGVLDVESAPGAGTTVRVQLPKVVQPAEPSSPTAPDPSWTGHGTVLVIDDDSGVRRVASQALELLGFRVLCAQDGGEAIELFGKHAAEIVLVLLDLSMPGPSGREVLAALQGLRPDVRVILSSGFPEDDAALGAFDGSVGYLQKPYRVETLRSRIQEILPARD